MTANQMKKFWNIKEDRSNKSSKRNSKDKVKKSYHIAQGFQANTNGRIPSKVKKRWNTGDTSGWKSW